MFGGYLCERAEVGSIDWFSVRHVEGPWGPVVDHHLERLMMYGGSVSGDVGDSRVVGDDDDGKVDLGP